MEQMKNFNKILNNLENIEVKIEDEDTTLQLLNALFNIFLAFQGSFVVQE